MTYLTKLKDKIKLNKIFKILASKSSDGILIANEKGFHIYANKKASKITGYTISELLKTSYKDLLHPSELDKVSSRFKKRIKGEIFQTRYETIIVDKNKKRVPIELSSTKINVDNSNYIIVSIYDITERKRAEEIIKYSEEKYRSIFENPIIGAYKSTLDGKYIDANSALIKMLGYSSKKELLLVDIKKDLYCSEKDRPSHNNRKKPFKVCLKRKDGSKIWVEVSSKVIYDNGKPTSYEGIVRNITEQKEAEESLKESEEKYRTLVQTLPTKIWLKDLDSVFISCNRALAKYLGIRPSDIVGKTDYDFFPKKMASKYRKDDKKVLKSGKTADIEEKQIQNEKKIYIHTIKTPVRDKDDKIYGTMGACWDITERKKAEKALKESEKKFRLLYMSMREGAGLHEIIYNNSGKATDYRIIDVNKSYESILGLKRRSVIGKKASKVYKTGKPPYLDIYTKVAESGKSTYFETYFSPMKKHFSISVFSPEKGKFATIFSDITDRIKTENQLKYQSFHDGLTGLYNRTYFEEELSRLDTARQLPLSIIIGDVNGLKLINDAFGHAQGDKLLCKCAEVFEKCLRKEDIIARWGGDEFSILLPRTKNDTAHKLINRIRLRCARESSKRMPLSISLGLSTKEKSSQNIEEIAREAEGNMYKDKLLERKSITGSIISSLELALFEKEYETREHIERIKKLSTKLGKAVNLPISELNKLTLISTLHDIGKIAIPYEILFKKDKLLKKEWNIIKKHSEIGNNICKSSPMLSHIAEDILHHHEWWDGSGYPRGLKGKDIPITTGIITIVDAYDVMRHGRPYRKPISKKEAIKELRRCAGTQFSPSLVKKFIKIIKK
jgi:diguanylate cyclase (GGDEF)-like protein/PAS domain S-box-containing protein